MSESLISSILVSDVGKSLRTLTKNERPWTIRSGCSEEIRDRERIAQVAHKKWAIEKPMSEFPALKILTVLFLFLNNWYYET